MQFKSILAPIGGTDSDIASLTLAARIARRFSAHVDVFHAKADPRESMPYLGEGASPALIDQVMVSAERDSDTRAARARANFETWQAQSGLSLAPTPGVVEQPSCALRLEAGAEDKWIARLGRLSDMTIVAEPGEGSSVAAMLAFEAALLDTGRPVMMAPIGYKTNDSGSVVVAWNGSAESSRAVQAGLPFLQQAKSVHVVAVEESANTPDADAVVRYLAWHRIGAKVRLASGKGRPAAQAIVAECEAVDAALLVMGGYTHNRLRQMIFGGVTAHVIRHATIPVLMAH
jgi:nucleotide-binding universal stress UspA family protein